MTEKKIEKKAAKKEAPKKAAAEAKAEEPKKEKAKKAKDPSGERKVVKIFPSERKAIVSIGQGGKENTYKVVYQLKRKTGQWLLGNPSGEFESVTQDDWLAGKADIGLAS